jgi:hypothetical protein
MALASTWQLRERSAALQFRVRVSHVPRKPAVGHTRRLARGRDCSPAGRRCRECRADSSAVGRAGSAEKCIEIVLGEASRSKLVSISGFTAADLTAKLHMP